jgi:hypothetical protein
MLEFCHVFHNTDELCSLWVRHYINAVALISPLIFLDTYFVAADSKLHADVPTWLGEEFTPDSWGL